MNLINAQRITKVIENLVANPTLIPKYGQLNISGKRLPIDSDYPSWSSHKAVKYADTIVAGKKVFQYGTGAATIRFSKKAKSIVAVEEDIKWADSMQKLVEELKIDNVEIKYCSYNFYEPEEFENSGYIKMIDNDEYDIVIIDGQDYSLGERTKCFLYAEQRMKTGQYIIVDDLARDEEIKKTNTAKEVKVFDSAVHYGREITSTAVFCY